MLQGQSAVSWVVFGSDICYTSGSNEKIERALKLGAKVLTTYFFFISPMLTRF